MVSFYRHHNHPPPFPHINFENYTAHEAARKKKRERWSFKGEERSYFIPIGRKIPNQPIDFSFQFEGNRSASSSSSPLPYFPTEPQESRNERSRFVSRRRHASNVSCIKIILILVFEGGETERSWLSAEYIYIYILAILRFSIGGRVTLISYDHRKTSCVSLFQSGGGGNRPLLV